MGTQELAAIEAIPRQVEAHELLRAPTLVLGGGPVSTSAPDRLGNTGTAEKSEPESSEKLSGVTP